MIHVRAAAERSIKSAAEEINRILNCVDGNHSAKVGKKTLAGWFNFYYTGNSSAIPCIIKARRVGSYCGEGGIRLFARPAVGKNPAQQDSFLF